jgi:predicted ester cyclase
MSNTDPKSVVLSMMQALDRQDWPVVAEHVAPVVRAQVGGQTFDRAGWQAMGQAFYAAFPDGRHELRQVLVDGERVTVHATFTGTHRGPFMGLPPTGRMAHADIIHISRVVGGRITEHDGQFDAAGLMAQLTAAPVDAPVFIRSLYDRVDRLDFAGAHAMLAETCRFQMGSQDLDRHGWEEMGKMFFAAFPDGKHVLTDIISAGNRITAIGTFSGTHKGSFMGVPASGRAMKIGFISVTTLAAGKVAEMRIEIDSAGLMQQITA